ncbi:MAG: hypothetical protein A3I61_14415 [Acidobacteria bacterium RIFCSPLOWO2_02_FULL_68_18]|nr:MAG: hypothetical protein A3I61_14415 [Acidobacteria bacterium RIFCSPLOWO2_02_FULL_68_18]
MRKARFFQHDAYISIDYAAQEVEMYRLVAHSTAAARGGPRNGDGPNGLRPAIQGGRVDVVADEPLRRELADFAAAIRERRPPAVTGTDGRAALALATRVSDIISSDLSA